MLKLFLLVIMLSFSFTAFAGSERSEADELTDYFFAAARIGDADVLKMFLEHGYPVNTINAQSYTALMTATYYGHAQAVDLLLAHGADACIRDKRGHTAMMGAVVKAEWKIARTLYRIDCEAQPEQQGVKTLAEFAEVFGQTEKLAALKQEMNGTTSK